MATKTNQLTWVIGKFQKEGSTEKIDYSKNPGFTQFLELNNVLPADNFNISIRGNNVDEQY